MCYVFLQSLQKSNQFLWFVFEIFGAIQLIQNKGKKNFKNHKITKNHIFVIQFYLILFLTYILLDLYFVCIWLQYWFDISFFRNSNICCFGWAEWHTLFCKNLLIFYSPSPLGGDIFAAILQQQAIIPQQHIKGRKIQ